MATSKRKTCGKFYSVGPQSTPNSAQWRTELNRPLTS